MLCYAIIAGKLATMRDLQTDYSLEDAMDLVEVARVKSANEAILLKEGA